MNSRSQASTGARGKRIIFVNKYFYPDHSATSQILSDLVFYLARSGYAVHVITSTQRYDDPRADLPRTEERNGVLISRLGTAQFGRSSLLGRGVDYLSFYRAAYRSLVNVASPGDIVVTKTDPPLLGVAVMQAAKTRRVRLVNWLQDLYPEVAMQLRVPLIRGPVAQWLIRVRDMGLHAAEANVVVGQRMAEVLRARGVESNRIKIIPNWCDDEEIRPISSRENPLRREWVLEDKFVAGYSGNLGMGHEFETVLAAAEVLRSDPRITFLLIGGGSKFGELARNVHKRKLDHLFRFMPYQDRRALKYSLNVPDVHWFSLKPELEGIMVPSKFYGIAAAARPMIAITHHDGELARLIRVHRCGEVVEPGNGEHLAAILRKFSTEVQRREQMGRYARAMLESHFARRRAFQRWLQLLEALDPA
jgi:glycosyltransferase involved in cell wall biosynthesis